VKMDNSPARGTRDLLPSAVATRDHVLATITEVYHRFGYQRIETPALEDINRLTGGQGGENEKLLFQVLRRGLPGVVEADTPLSELIDLGLRFDLTVPLTRFYGNNQAVLPTPFRAFQVGPVWRAERPAKGRYRQFYQCDIDMIGEASVLAEVELIEATAAALAGVGLSGTSVRLSDRRYLSALAAAVGLDESTWSTFFIGLDKLDKIGWDGVRAELTGRDLPAEAVDAARELIEGLTGLAADKVADTLSDTVPSLDENVVADLGTVAGCLDELSGLTWEFDPTLVRGMGYYTGQIFEVGHPSVSYSLAGGGRYDRLIGRSLGKDVPACGFSIGFERIVDMLGELPRQDSVVVLFESDVPLATALRVARDVRTGGRTAAVQPRSGKFGAQLGRLEAAGYTSLVHLKADTVEPEERPLGK
jgi:histidyl-tRNA synthetase